MSKNFYSDISSQYDEVFKANDMQLNFIKSFLKEDDAKLLEVGCGTGSLALKLSEYFKSVSAIDLNSDMISKAKEKDENNSVSFLELSMLDIEENFNSDSLDLISCIGNTLVHLDSLEQINAFLKSSFNALKEGGSLLIQIVNYDRVIDNNIEELPLIDNDKITFVRKYNLVGDKVRFDTKLFSKDENRSYENSIMLIALRKNKLESLLQNVGFKDIEFYSNFKKDEWNNNSMPTRVSAKK